MTIILFLIILAVLILVHELGHFIAAKLFGIRVDEFALGFPPRLFGKKIGETTYSINALPLGGYVKIFGEDAPKNPSHSSETSRTLYAKPKWIQAIVLSAGVAMNILFAYILITAGFMIGLPTPVDATPYGTVTNPQLTITSVLPNSPADMAHLVPGDIITAAGNEKDALTTLTPDSVSNLIATSNGQITLTYITADKNNVTHTVSLTPLNTIVAGRQAVGMSMDMIGTLQLPMIQAMKEGAQTTWDLLKNIVISLWQFFAGVFTLHSDLSQVSGPVGIAKVVGEASAIGFVYLLSLVALISLNLAVINLIPFPALDGGRLFFILLETLMRRAIHPKVNQYANTIGFIILLTLMAVVTFHDIWGIL